jgi:RNA exonuclease 4
MDPPRGSQWKVNAPEWHPPPPAPPPAPVDPFLPNTALDMGYKSFLAPFAESAVAIDCEMVGVRPGDTSALAHVAICDFNGNQIYNKYVIPRGGIESITNYRTPYSGIVKDVTLVPFIGKPENSFDVVQQEVHHILNGRVIVGHGLDSDFTALEYIPFPFLVWDSTKIPKYLRPPTREGALPQARRLKELASMIGNSIQRNEVNAAGRPRGHSPLEDARAAMNLFRTYLGEYKVDYSGRNMRH